MVSDWIKIGKGGSSNGFHKMHRTMVSYPVGWGKECYIILQYFSSFREGLQLIFHTPNGQKRNSRCSPFSRRRPGWHAAWHVCGTPKTRGNRGGCGAALRLRPQASSNKLSPSIYLQGCKVHQHIYAEELFEFIVVQS